MRSSDVIPRSGATRNLLFGRVEKQILRFARNNFSGGSWGLIRRRTCLPAGTVLFSNASCDKRICEASTSMRAVVQRVSRAAVRVESRTVAEIGTGLLVLVGIGANDTPEGAVYLAEKVADLRIFPDAEGKMNRSVSDTGGDVLAVSQFTLFGDARKGRRPSFASKLAARCSSRTRSGSPCVRASSTPCSTATGGSCARRSFYALN